MPVPKKRQSKSKTNSRKSSWKRKVLKPIEVVLSRSGLTKDNLRSYPNPSFRQQAMLGVEGLDQTTNQVPFKRRRGRKTSKGFASKQESTITSTNRGKPEREGK